MGKNNFLPPVSSGSANSFSPLEQNSPKAENTYQALTQNKGLDAEKKNEGVATEHALNTSDVEIFSIAAISLLQQNNFASAFKLLDTGYKQLSVSARKKSNLLLEDIEAAVEKLRLADQQPEADLAHQLNLVKLCLLNPLDRDACFTAVGALADFYTQSGRDDLCEDLSAAFLEILTTIR